MLLSIFFNSEIISALGSDAALLESRINQRLRDLGKKKNWLMGQLDLSAATFWRKTSGKSDLTYKEMRILAEALECTPEYLTGEIDLPFGSEFVAPVTHAQFFRDSQKLLDGPLVFGSEIGATIPENQAATTDKDSNTAPGAVQDNAGNTTTKKPDVPADLSPLSGRLALVRILPKEFAACCGSDVSWLDDSIAFELEYWTDDSDLVRHSPVIAMSVIGDSMEPDIEDGDYVVFTNSVSEIDYAPNGSIVIVNYDGRMIVRGLFRKPDRVILKAWNKDYDDIEIKMDEELHICGLVLRLDKFKRPRPML